MKTSIAAPIALLGLSFVSAPVLAQQPGPQPAKVEIGLAEIPETQLDKYVEKSNGVVELLNTSLRASESWYRYLSWVDVNRGPTGKERIIYGLYSVSDPSAKDAIASARTTAAADPAIPALDEATKKLADAFEALFPVLNEAEAYYDRKDYYPDRMKGGRELHRRIVPAAQAYLAARERVERLQEQFKDLLDRQQLARTERTEGKSVRWHARFTMMQAKKAVDLMPRDPRKPGNLQDFDKALTGFGEAVKEFDRTVRESGKSYAGDSFPRDLLGKLREMRAELARGHVNGMSYGMDVSSAISSYNWMVRTTDRF